MLYISLKLRLENRVPFYITCKKLILKYIKEYICK